MREIVIDGGLVPTARLKNQTLMDYLLDKSLINIKEHIASEYVLGQCVKAGINVKSVPFDGMPFGSGDSTASHNGLMPLRSTIKLVIRKCDRRAASVLIDAVALEVLRANELPLLRDTLNVISDHRLTMVRHS